MEDLLIVLLPPFNDVADLSQEVVGEGCEAVRHVWREGRLGDAVHQSLLLQVVERSNVTNVHFCPIHSNTGAAWQ